MFEGSVFLILKRNQAISNLWIIRRGKFVLTFNSKKVVINRFILPLLASS